ncbi:hypothetical protein ACJIZ3_023846 [Penstemon smallii]|uniref:Uncharacterized protein n=1 Tax=Penstemon smallii TaxID=265156 RepID=A0ABD3TQD4_9LAMI
MFALWLNRKIYHFLLVTLSLYFLLI